MTKITSSQASYSFHELLPPKHSGYILVSHNLPGHLSDIIFPMAMLHNLLPYSQVADLGRTPLRGFVVSYKKNYGEWREKSVPPSQHRYIIEDLQCGTKYQFFVTAHNKVGTLLRFVRSNKLHQ